jgi:hydrogenase maturation factor HypF (carbamoyltransferase family)
LKSYRKAAGFKQIETTGGVERNEELVENNSSYFAAAAVKQVQQS